MKKGSSATIVVTLISLMLLGVIGYLLFLLYQMKTTSETATSIEIPTPMPTVTIPAPVSTVLESTPTGQQKIPTSTIQQISDSELIRQAMAAKHSKSIHDTTVSVSKIDATHAWGSVKFADEISGGWFLAYKKSGSWMIVEDGNGTIDCSVISPYNFPSDMVPECWDVTTQKIIYR